MSKTPSIDAQMQDRLKANLLRAREDALAALQQAQANEKRTHGYTPQSQITITSASDKKRAKEERKAAAKRRKQRPSGRALDQLRVAVVVGIDVYTADHADIDLSAEELERIRLEVLEANANRPLFDPNGVRIESTPQYPHVYAASTGGGTLSFLGQRYSLPQGTTRTEQNNYWEVTIPTPSKLPMREGEELIRVQDLDPLARGSFKDYTTLNRLQSLVYPVAYNTNENMLVCAPTGAGKTDVAMLAVLRALSQHADDVQHRPLVPAADFKIIYVAPMKALAAEVVRKMGKRLSWLGIVVRELTGDMQLTRAEIAATHFIVTTPEKWDVVTRKPEGDADLASKVRLLIIDEVHLLHDDRGAVIESIVARTLRQVESSQLLIRIVGLSATLPNYIDVADFLRVNRYQGLFYFDSSFRPVPLEQHFIGVKGKAGSQTVRDNLDRATFDKVAELIRGGHQVMVFVHSRKDTVKTAEMLRFRFQEEEDLAELVDPKSHPRYDLFKRDLVGSRNRELKDLFESGLGIHHAGMLRSDRNISERLFEQDVTKVLVCTATLAWGVNLPAYAVVIKGTQIFDSAKGTFVDLSILDVLQIFGRAGRPQYETHGVGYICTSYDRLDHYVSAITQQHPIESKFETGLLDSLNAEIALGTVTSLDAGVRWIGYTYMFVRMRKNPQIYGLTVDELMDDPALGSKRHLQVSIAVKRLVEAQMITLDRDTGALASTELGRIASKYYLRHASIEIFNKTFRASMGEADVLAVLSSSVEFDQLKVRESEVDDLKVMEDHVPCRIKGGSGTTPGKVNVLLQAYISRTVIHDFALISDCGYVAQNAGRIARALLDIAVSRRWSSTTAVLVSLSKAIEKRMWSYEHPLAQLQLPSELMYNINRYIEDYDIGDLIDTPPVGLGKLIHLNERFGSMTRAAARQLPYLLPSIRVQPVTHDLLRVCVSIERRFDWVDRLHGRQEPFWIWISDEDDREILQLSRLLVFESPLHYTQTFVVSVASLPPKLHLRIISDRWFGSEDTTEINLEAVVMPPHAPSPLPLLDLPLLRLVQTENAGLVQLFDRTDATLDPVMTQCFHSLFHSRSNALFCVSSPGNWQLLLEMSIWCVRASHISASKAATHHRQAIGDEHGSATALVICPQRSLALRMQAELGHRFAGQAIAIETQLRSTRDEARIEGRSVCIISPEVLRAGLADGSTSAPIQLRLVVSTHLHLLDADYELALARLRQQHQDVRFVGIAFPLSDPRDLAAALGVPTQHTYHFSPSTSAEPSEAVFAPFSTPHSAGLLHAMVAPTYEALASAEGSAICVVPTRGQCRITARDLVTLIGSEFESDGFLGGAGQAELELHAAQTRDIGLAEAIGQGVGIWHDGMAPADQRLVLQLYATRVIRVLVIPRELAWSLPASVSAVASLTVVMGAQHVVASMSRDNRTRQVRDYGLGEVVQLTQLARASSVTGRCIIMCQASQAELYARYLRTGLPLESHLVESGSDDGVADGMRVLRRLLTREVGRGSVKSRQDAVDLLSWTYLATRLRSNPDYYAHSHRTLSSLVDALCDELRARGLVRLPAGEAHEIEATELAKRIVPKGEPVLDRLDRLLEQGPEAASKLLGSFSVEVDDEALRKWQKSLRKSARDALDGTDEGDRPSSTAVLLAGFFTGRTPADAELARAQADVVEAVLGKMEGKRNNRV